MSVQNKILLLLLAIVATLVGGLVALKSAEDRKFRAIAVTRAAERNKNFDAFLQERGDNLKALVEDSSTWNDMVRAVVKGDSAWAEQTINDGMLATYKANAIWIYKADHSLFYSRNNRYSDNLRELPIPPEAFATLFGSSKICHFFIQVPQGWMEIRGGTIHPSIDAQRETTPQGFFFAGHIWIDDNIRRMSLFTGYDIHIIPTADLAVQNVESDERTGLITFSRQVPGWDGKPAASIVVRNESPLIRELNEASERQFLWLMVFSLLLFLTLCASLLLWVRRPLHQLAEGLRTGDPHTVAPLTRRDDEFGHLAELILKFRQTQEALEHAEEQLRHSQKLEAVGRLAGGVAHDFNNLLTAIIGYSELLAPKLNGDPEAHEFVRTIHQAGEKAAGLTRQLLAFSRRQILLPKVLDLNAVVCEMDKLLQRVIGEHIRFEIDTSATDARVLADPLQLEQVILNLGVNARDAMPGGGKLKISTENRTEPPCEEAVPCPAGYVLLIVSDTGSGMDAATRERIFEPFFTTKGPGKGTGLGLATVYGIVKQSGGGITVESEIGKGSRFIIHLPRETRAIEEAPAPAPLDATRNAETILVVEDEEVVRQLVCAVLREAGYEVLCAGTPTEALDLADRHDGKIDLLLTDVVMPEMHGPTLAEILKKKRSDLAVLFVSGYSENDISDQGVLNAGLDVLQKPFTHQSLIRKVREMLDEASTASAN